MLYFLHIALLIDHARKRVAFQNLEGPFAQHASGIFFIARNELPMNFDQQEFIPEPSNWFSLQVQYEGWGTAEFADPAGTVEGPTKVVFNELGDPIIEMLVETVHTEQKLEFGLSQLVTGGKVFKLASGLSMNHIISALGIYSARHRIHQILGNPIYASSSSIWSEADTIVCLLKTSWSTCSGAWMVSVMKKDCQNR